MLSSTLLFIYSFVQSIARALVIAHLRLATSTAPPHRPRRSSKEFVAIVDEQAIQPPHHLATDIDAAKQPTLLIEAFEDRFLFGARAALPPITATDKFELSANSSKSPTDAPAVSAQLRVRDLDFFVRVVSRADVGFAEAYVAGEFDTPDLLGLLKYMIHLRDSTAARLKQRATLADDAALVATTAALGTLSTIGRMASSLYHWSRRNSTANTRANIGAHYDLGNDFFRLFLDHETMAYSCAVYDAQHSTLEAAQVHKFDRLHRLLQLDDKSADDDQRRKRVLEVGNGWGSLSIAMAQAGHNVTGLTLSSEQQRHVNARAEALGLTDRVQTLLQDYRLHKCPDEAGYDGIVSCEMLEAVGHEFLPAFFQQMERLLKPGGRLVLQVIVTPDHRYERYRRHADFVQLYVFPGGLCPSLGAISEAMRGTQLAIEHIDSIGPHYARTLHEWRDRFESKLSEVRALGFDEQFVRMWRYYFVYCEAAFETRTMNAVQIAIRKHF